MRRIISILAFVAMTLPLAAQNLETVPFGDFENWTVRYIKESGLIGGETKPLYVVAPKDTIRANKVYDYSKTIWAGSNAYAVVMGVTKASVNVTPEKGPTGLCARMETVQTKVKAIGVINISVVASGSLFWGKMLEPIKSADNPMSTMSWGIPFTKRPKALVLDYKAELPNTGKLMKGKEVIAGYDEEQVLLILQNRTEDAQGNIHAKRVGTAVYRISKSTGKWVKDHRIPVIYGDATKDASYKAYMGLKTGEDTIYSLNSKGVNVPVIEDGWASTDTPVTHALLSVCTSSGGAFTAAIGNILWVDNIRLEY